MYAPASSAAHHWGHRVPQLVSINVDGLLNRFTHDIEFPAAWEFVILHGPNGVGKTKVLELVDAVAAGRLYSVLRIPFDTAELGFDDGSTLGLVRTAQLPLPEIGEDQPSELLNVILERPGAEPVEFSVAPEEFGVPESRLRMLERELPVDRIARDEWWDYNLDDSISTQELLERYPVAGFVPGEVSIPHEFREFTQEFNVHLIVTQRLFSFAPRSRTPRGRPTARSTVMQYAEDLTQRLSAALAENSRTSQELDRTFPRRVLEEAPPAEVTDDEIRTVYQEQSELRDRLAEIAVLDTSADVPLPDRDLEGWERRVLWTYLGDSARKLETFSQLQGRVRLMRDIVNSRFLFKELQIDRERGFRIWTEDGSDLSADALSSGEQHELVLLYDLLFNVTPGSTVLIDEPEISLHVTWQQKFLDDISRVAEVASLRFVVATHSPQIIHKWWDRTERLYGEPDA